MQARKTLRKAGWDAVSLRKLANAWFKHLYRRKRLCYAHCSLWWWFAYRWQGIRDAVIAALIAGHFQFSPMRLYRFPDHIEISWDYPERLALSLLHKIMKPTFKHIIPPTCLHLGGPRAVKTAIAWVKKSLEQRPYRYMIRADVKGYYASIDRKILMRQLRQHYDDPRLLNYLDAIVNHSIDDGGVVSTAHKGIPLRSSLSNFFGALYLAELDRSFKNVKGCFYVRFCDDIVILAQTKRQYLRAKRRLRKHVQQLRLKLSPTKTRMGKLAEKTFHFLGVTFDVSQNTANKFQAPTLTLHARSCRRSIERVNLMLLDAVPTAKIQSYLVRWSGWWARSMNQKGIRQLLLEQWLSIANQRRESSLTIAIGSGILTRAKRGLRWCLI